MKSKTNIQYDKVRVEVDPQYKIRYNKTKPLLKFNDFARKVIAEAVEKREGQ